MAILSELVYIDSPRSGEPVGFKVNYEIEKNGIKYDLSTLIMIGIFTQLDEEFNLIDYIDDVYQEKIYDKLNWILSMMESFN